MLTTAIRKKTFILLVIFFCILLSGCLRKSTIKTTHPVRGKIQQSFVEKAKTRLDKIYDINMPITGKLESNYFRAR